MYDWKRFWCRLGATLRLSDDGFLSDPESDYGSVTNPSACSFDDIGDAACLVLLGEPGIGKSTAVQNGIHSTQRTLEGGQDTLIHVDLGEYGDESRLINDVFESTGFSNWLAGSHTLHLFLDSLDECRLQIPQVAKILSRRLGKLGGKLGRMRLRIACRTADWPESLTDRFEELWGKDAPALYELVPLRRKDVAEAAVAEGMNANEFLNEIARVAAQPFAIKPITLKFLIRTYASSGRFPSTQAELYAEGCRLLCQESNPDRESAGHVGRLAADERVRIAERIAAMIVFCNRSAIYTGLGLGIPTDDLTISEVVDDPLADPAGRVSIREVDVRETIATGLFSGRGEQRVGFGHRTYAEFLAASYVVHSGIDLPERLKLIRHADDADGRIVPQLRETAALLATLDGQVFQKLTATDPQVLVRSDVANVTAENRRILVDRLLQLSHNGDLLDWDWDDRFHYQKLAHVTIAEQLAPHLRDREAASDHRRFAIDLTQACRVAELQSILVEIALDPSDNYDVRYRAAYVVMEIGNAESHRRLKPLLSCTINDDPQFKLRTAVLEGLWPIGMSGEDLFSSLQVPTEDAYGSYSLFLSHHLPDRLSQDDLPHALKWAARLTEADAHEYAVEKFLSRISRMGWERLDVPEICDAYGQYALARLRVHADIVPLTEGTIDAEDASRRELVAKIVPRFTDFDSHGYGLTLHSPGLVRTNDIEWLVERVLAETDPLTARRWAILVARVFDSSVTGQLDLIISACNSSAAMQAEFEPLLAPIRLDSEEAARLRRYHAEHTRMLREAEERRNPPPLDPPPAVRIENALRECESGNSEAWISASRDLQLELNSRRYDHDLETDLTVLPGWQTADSTTRARIIDGASQFLCHCDPNGQRWLGTGSTPYIALWGYKAFFLLNKEASPLFESLSAQVWERWASTVVSFYDHQESDKDKRHHNELAQRCASVAPTAVCDCLRTIFRRYVRTDGLVVLPEFLRRCWNDEIHATLLEEVRRNAVRPPVTGALLKVLLAKACVETHRLASSFVSNIGEDSSEDTTERAIRAAIALVESAADAGWIFVWPAMQTNNSFGRRVMEEVAYNNMHNPWLARRLSESDAADLFIWLETNYPRETDPRHKGAHAVSTRDALKEYRDGVLSVLRERGTSAAIQSLERIQVEFPGFDWMRFVLADAKKTFLRSSWRPLTPRELRDLTQRRHSRLVRNAGHLQEVVLESLSDLQVSLQGETPASQFLWNRIGAGKYRPKDENDLSDFVTWHLGNDLRQRGIVSLREVQIRRSTGANPGERTDIHITGIVAGAVPGSFDTVRVIIEVKGEWNGELDTAMETQLTNRYLADNTCCHGIYLVGWFRCPQWDPGDRRSRTCRDGSLETLRIRLENQASALCTSNRTVRTCLLNAALR